MDRPHPREHRLPQPHDSYHGPPRDAYGPPPGTPSGGPQHPRPATSSHYNDGRGETLITILSYPHISRQSIEGFRQKMLY